MTFAVGLAATAGIRLKSGAANGGSKVTKYRGHRLPIGNEMGVIPMLLCGDQTGGA